MTDQELYYNVVKAYFHFLYRIPLDLYVAEIVDRFRQAGYTNTDVPDALYHALAALASQAEGEKE